LKNPVAVGYTYAAMEKRAETEKIQSLFLHLPGKMIPMQKPFVHAGRGFTLIELLLVVGILILLAAVGIPHLLEAQTRAKVSAAKSNLRVLASALECYRVDHSHYPPMRSQPPEDPLGLLADHQLTVLTTPLAYASASAMRDPFGVIRQRAYGFSRPGSQTAAVSIQPNPASTDLPVPTVVNPARSLLYYEYPSFSALALRPELRREAVALISIGPDSRDSFSVYAPFAGALPPLALQLGFQCGADCLYDPTNGTVSEGDIPRYTGDLSFFPQP
jgi:type II secretory pathway pseudopilin PulG